MMSMKSTARFVIATLLCLLLPLQAGAAVVRSASMSAQHAASENLQSSGTPLQLAHAIGMPHQHGAHAHQDKLPNKKADKRSKSRGTQQVKTDCHDGATCCLFAAAAPPSANAQCVNPAMARVAFSRHSLPAIVFITEGPERPPRFLA